MDKIDKTDKIQFNYLHFSQVFKHYPLPGEPIDKFIPADLHSFHLKYPDILEPINELSETYISNDITNFKNFFDKFEITNSKLKTICNKFIDSYPILVQNQTKITWKDFINFFSDIHSFSLPPSTLYHPLYDLDHFIDKRFKNSHKKAINILNTYIPILISFYTIEHFTRVIKMNRYTNIHNFLHKFYNSPEINIKDLEYFTINLSLLVAYNTMNMFSNMKIYQIILSHIFIPNPKNLKTSLKTISKSPDILAIILFRYNSIISNSNIIKPDFHLSLPLHEDLSLHEFNKHSYTFIKSILTHIHEYIYTDIYFLYAVYINPHKEFTTLKLNRQTFKDKIFLFSKLFFKFPLRKLKDEIYSILHQNQDKSLKQLFHKMQSWNEIYYSSENIEKQLNSLSIQILDILSKSPCDKYSLEKKIKLFHKLNHTLKLKLGHFYNLPKPPPNIYQILKSLYFLYSIEPF